MSVKMNLKANERDLLVVCRLYPGGYKNLAPLYRLLQAMAAWWVKLRLGSHYRKISALERDRATLDLFVSKVKSLTSESQVKALDVFLFLHGSDGEIIFEGGAEKTSEIKKQLLAIDTKGKLRACYSVVCHGESHCQDLIAAGFWVTSGAKAINVNGAVELPLFLRQWATGETYETAVRKAGFASTAQDWAAQIAVPSGVIVDSTKVVRGRSQTRITTDPAAIYEITLKTGDMLGAGTDADVYIKLHGRCNGQDVNSRWVALDIPGLRDLERGDTDIYHVKAVALDDIKSVTVKHSNTGWRPGWFLEKGAIRNMTSHKRWNFGGGWLAVDEPPYRTERRFSVQRA